MESLAKGNTIFFVEWHSDQRELSVITSVSKSLYEKRKQLKKSLTITLGSIYNLNCFSQLAQLLYYLSSQLFRLIAIV
jgi:hypothetical protein